MKKVIFSCLITLLLILIGTTSLATTSVYQANLNPNNINVSLGNTAGASIDKDSIDVSIGNSIDASVTQNNMAINLGGVNFSADQSSVNLEVDNDGFLGSILNFIENIINIVLAWMPFFN